MSFLNVKIMFKLFYIISRYDTSIWFTSVAKMTWTCFPQIDRKGLSNVLTCFLTVKTYQGQIIQIFFFEISSRSILYIWNRLVLRVHHQTTFNMFLPNYKSKKLKIFCAFRAAFGKQSNPETLKFLLVCFALTCKLILMERSVSHNETDIQKISNKKKTIKKWKEQKN